MYTQNHDEHGQLTSITCDTHNHVIPIDLNNRHFQQVLDQYNTDPGCFTDAHPVVDHKIRLHAENRLQSQQRFEYQQAIRRLEQPQLSLIESLSAQVEQTSYDFDNPENTITTLVDNPTIVQDESEREQAQRVIDNTPEHIKQTES